MIAFLRGRLIEKHPNRVIVDVQGVGYEAHVPLSTFYQVGETGSDIALRVHTHVREDALALFGFVTALEQQIFERLIGVSGVGPKLALAVLSGLDPEDLVTAIRASDIARLTAIPGIGRKTAERISLELKDRLPAVTAGAPGDRTATRADEFRDDVLSALLNLGYHRGLAEKALDAALAALGPTAAFETIFRDTLKRLSK